jgi:RNA polymerase sigma-70 factor (ECF subfamily)
VTPHLLRVVRRVLGPEHPDVEDVAQESAFALMDALPRHRGECTILHFACRVALLTAMNVR